jgi:protein involved in polysaccharide export with SLBB domain
MGEVQKPGQYNLERGTTVLMGISIGGGLTPKAAPNRTKIVREVDGKKTEIKAIMEALVQPGDTIIVPESFF